MFGERRELERRDRAPPQVRLEALREARIRPGAEALRIRGEHRVSVERQPRREPGRGQMPQECLTSTTPIALIPASATSKWPEGANASPIGSTPRRFSSPGMRSGISPTRSRVPASMTVMESLWAFET